MCRWFSYIGIEGKSILIEDAIVNPVNALAQQQYGNFQEESLLNADGFGVAWYTTTLSDFDVNEHGTHPSIYKATGGKPVNDTTFRFIVRNNASNVILSHIRGAYGTVARTNNHPFVFGRSTFMHNGFIVRFQDMRSELLRRMRTRYMKLISGSTDTEHLAALYFSYLEDEEPEGNFGPNSREMKYPALSMWNALKRAIQDVEKIQLQLFGQKQNNTLNISTTNGESYVALCYRSNPFAPPNTIFVSLKVGDELDRKSPSWSGTYGGMDERGLEKAAEVFKTQVKHLTEDDLKHSNVPHIVVASEPTNFKADEWRKMDNGEAVLLDKKKTTLQLKLRVMPLAPVAGQMHPFLDKRLMMFQNDVFAVIDVTDPTKKTVAVKPVPIDSLFSQPSADVLLLLRAGVDVAIPNLKKKEEMHFFMGDQYIYVKVISGPNTLVPDFSVLIEPSDISKVWKCLNMDPFNKGISAILFVPGHENEAWFFRESKYVRVSWTQGGDGTIKDSKLKGKPKNIFDGWPSLAKVELSTVDMTIPDWNNENAAYFFSGNEVVLVDLRTEISIGGEIAVRQIGGTKKNFQDDWPTVFYSYAASTSIPPFNFLGEDDPDLVAGIIDRSNANRVTFYHVRRFVDIEIRDNEKILRDGPLDISQSKLGFVDGGVDAVLPADPNDGKWMHIFGAGKSYYIPDYSNIGEVPQGINIAERWGSLKAVGFNTIDAVLEVPGKNELWFFSGGQCVRVSWTRHNDGTVASEVLEGNPPLLISKRWPALRQAGIYRVFTIVPKISVKVEKQAWFFSDSKHVLLSIKPDPNECKFVEAPGLIKEGWAPLKSFYD